MKKCTLFCLLFVVVILCACSKKQKEPLEELFSPHGEWKPINSKQIITERNNE